ncbi:MAG: TonB-dependent receptor [Steroidobacteraceae bacterium]
MNYNQKLAYAISAILSGYTGNSFAATATDADTAGASGIEEIVVTAQRRSESIQDVPITIQAITGEQLGQLNVTTFDDVLKYLPNVTFGSNGPGQGNIYMRGLSAGFAGNQSSAAVAPFPNVATYLDDQSMTFPARNADVYMADMERIEVLEGPQGTLFGGGAEAGAIRYITNKPKLNVTEGNAEASYGTTAHGDPNTAVTAVINIPLIEDTLAVRAVIYDDRRGGYINNVPSTFTRLPTDNGPASYHLAYPANAASANNYALAANAQNPVTYQGIRVSALWQVNSDWSVLIQQSYQNMDAEGMDEQYPIGSEGQPLGPWQVTAFSPSYDKDKYENTSWTVNGKVGDLKLVYTGGYLDRTIDNAMDYTNYARSQGGFYYTCAGGGAPIGKGVGPLTCYSPVSSWLDQVETTHQSHELRLSTPDDWRLRGLIGAFWEDYVIKDDMNFLYKSIPSCTPANLALYQAGTQVCVGNVIPAPGYAPVDPTVRNDDVAFGEDIDRGYHQTAFFTSIDYDLIPKVLTATAGTRYYRYTETFWGSQYSTGTGSAGVPNGQNVGSALTAATHDADYSGFRSRGNLTWHVTPDAMVYYTFSQGFRPGAANRKDSAEIAVAVVETSPGVYAPAAGTVAGPTLVKQYNKPYTYPPDTLINNEIGWKTEWFDHRLLVNGSAYVMDWNNVQTLIYNPPVSGNTTFGVEGPDYRVKGVELQIVGRVTDSLTLQGSLSHNNATQTNSPCLKSSNAVANNPTPIGSCITEYYNSALSENVPLLNPLGAVGSTPAFSPTIEYNIRARYDWSLDAYKMFFTVGAQHVGDMQNEPSSFASGAGVLNPTTTWLRYDQPAYTTYDAAWGIAKDQWHVEAFGQNLGNSDASQFTTSGQFIEAQVPLRPRVLGIKVGMKF